MKVRAADPKKYVAGWCVIVAAIGTAIIGIMRDSGGAVFGGILFAISGWGILSEAKVKKEVPPDLQTVHFQWHGLVGSRFVVIWQAKLYSLTRHARHH